LVYGIGGIYRFESTNSFKGTGTLTIAYSPAEAIGFNQADLRIYYLRDGTNRWEIVGGAVNAASNTVTATIARLGTYALAPPMPTGDLQLIPSTNTLAADGASEMTITVTNVFLNTGEVLQPPPYFGGYSGVATQQWIFTATAVGANLLSPDFDPETPGVQVLSTNGAVTLFLQAPVGGTVARVSMASMAGDAFGTVAINMLDNTPPAAPKDISITAAQSRIWISWQMNSDPDLAGYRVYYRMGAAGPPWDGTATVEGTSSPVMVMGTNCLLRGLILGTDYFVSVSTVDTTGNESPLTAAVQVTTTPGPPMPPTSLTVHFGADSTNILMWALSEDDGYNDRDVMRYDVWRAVLPGGSYFKIGEVRAGIGLFSEPNPVLSPGQYVDYAVTAVDWSGLQSSEALATSLLPAPMLKLSVGAPNGLVQLSVTGTTGQSYTIQASRNLVDWLPIQSFVSTTTVMTVVDQGATNFDHRFYRAVSP
jgi:Fibronectin type III domain